MEEAISRNSATVCQYGNELDIFEATACQGAQVERTGDNFAAEDNDEEAAEEGPSTAAQYLVLDRDIDVTVGRILDPLVDMIIAKVHTMIANNVQSVMDPICYVLSSRLDITETVLREDGDDEDRRIL